MVLQVVDDRPGPRDESSDRGERLAERPDRQVDPVRQPEVLGRPGAGVAQHTDGVGIVQGQREVELFTQRHQSGHVGDLALHAEHAVDDHHGATALLGA